MFLFMMPVAPSVGGFLRVDQQITRLFKSLFIFRGDSEIVENADQSGGIPGVRLEVGF